MNLELTKQMVTDYFKGNETRVAITSFEPDEAALTWLRENKYVFRKYKNIFCIAKYDMCLPRMESLVNLHAEIDSQRQKFERFKIMQSGRTIIE